MLGWLLVSIHAPVRGATLLRDDVVPDNMVSIHAPVRGATWSRFMATVVDRVSIHAPVRGATERGKQCKSY